MCSKMSHLMEARYGQQLFQFAKKFPHHWLQCCVILLAITQWVDVLRPCKQNTGLQKYTEPKKYLSLENRRYFHPFQGEIWCKSINTLLTCCLELSKRQITLTNWPLTAIYFVAVFLTCWIGQLSHGQRQLSVGIIVSCLMSPLLHVPSLWEDLKKPLWFC